MVMAIHSGTVPTWPASQPSVLDFSSGFQFHFSSGHRSRVLRVFCISWSNSPSIICPMVMTSSLAEFENCGTPILGEQKANCQALFLPTSAPVSRLVGCALPSCANAAIVTRNLPRRKGTSQMDLRVREEGTERRYGTPILHFLLERFDGCFSLLQEIGRASHGAVPGRSALHDPRCRIQFDRHHRETHGGKHAFALDRFSNQRWRKARP